LFPTFVEAGFDVLDLLFVFVLVMFFAMYKNTNTC
jgi:hypothetical protein